MRWRRRSAAPGPHPPLDALLADGFVAFDTETTGMDARSDRVVALAATRWGPHGETASLETLVDPGRPIPPGSTAVHGLDDTAVRGSPSLAEALPAFRAFVGDGIPVAHMAAFDLAFLRGPLAQAGLPALERVLDTAVLASRLLPPLPELSLDAVCARLDIPVVGRHTALGDARLAAAILVRLRPELERRGAATLRAALHWGDVTSTGRRSP
ncbi:MAG TPA: 3'-5' exonuclease [Candidatus Limnocylindria bacterium]|nr:3'-5' exonuclease [Candidatus Limnocylindria bacterium]